MPRPRKAVDIHALVAAAHQRIESINREKADLAKMLHGLLSSLGDVPSVRRGRRAGAFAPKGKGGRRPGFKLSAQARAKISAAQKKRWAAQRAKKA